MEVAFSSYYCMRADYLYLVGTLISILRYPGDIFICTVIEAGGDRDGDSKKIHLYPKVGL